MHAEAAPYRINNVLEKAKDEYDDTPNHRKHVLFDFVVALAKTGIHNPVEI